MENIPFYRTRHFWVVMYSLMLAWSVFFYFWAFYNPNALNPLRIIGDFLLSLGSTLYFLVGYKVIGTYGSWLGILLYILIQATLIRKTFTSNPTSLSYPLFVLLNFILGTLMSIIYLGSFI